MTTSETPTVAPRPELSVYWKPGCSSCLKLKEFVEETGLEFESVNVAEQPTGLDEIMAAGLRGIPVLRRGNRFIYAQSLDDVAELLGVSRSHERLSHPDLLERWDAILDASREIVSSFSEDMLTRPAIAIRDRPLKDLCSHVFQISDAFIKSVQEGVTDTRALTTARADIVTGSDLLSYVDALLGQYRAWKGAGGGQAIPDRLQTYYGLQPSGVVLERAVWHSAQHARQLDVIAAGGGAEFCIPPALYAGLPMPKRLWV